MNFKIFSLTLLTLASQLCAIDFDRSLNDGSLSHVWPTEENLPRGALDNFELLPTAPYPNIPEAIQPKGTSVANVDVEGIRKRMRRCVLEKAVIDAGLWQEFSQERAKVAPMQTLDQQEDLELQLLWEIAGRPRETQPDRTPSKRATVRRRAKERQQDLEERVRKNGRWEQFSCQFKAEAERFTGEEFIRPDEQEMLDNGSLHYSVLHRPLRERKSRAVAEVRRWLLIRHAAMRPPESAA